MNATQKPFGYVLKSNMVHTIEGQQYPTAYPWANPRRWSNASHACGNFRKYIGDAQVFKRVPKGYLLEVVPVYSDPRITGERSLRP